jgi:hypothetical protein
MLPEQIAHSAEMAVSMCEGRGGAVLDYSELSLSVVEEMLAEEGSCRVTLARSSRHWG